MEPTPESSTAPLLEPGGTAVPPSPPPVLPLLMPGSPLVEPPAIFRRLLAFLRIGFFDPFARFAFRVDRPAFLRGQGFLVALSLASPILSLVLGGIALALVHYGIHTLHPASAPAPFHRVALFPAAFVVVKGYWVAYLLLPLALLVVAWVWSAVTAWALVRGGGSLMDFRRGFASLATLGAMLGPFALFPFFRLLALGVLVWFSAKRLKETFAIPVGRFLGLGGSALVVAALGWGGFERWLEGCYPATPSLAAEMEGLRSTGTLEWPTRTPKKVPSKGEKILEELGTASGDPLKAAQARAWSHASYAFESPALRFAIMLKLAELGHAEAMLATVQNYRKGLGVAANLAEAEGWARRILAADPRHFQARMEEALLVVLRGERLAGKRRLVALAKEQPEFLGKVATFLEQENLGKANSMLTGMLSSLYMNVSAGRYESYQYNRGRPWEDGANISRRIVDLEADGHSCWFYNALLTEYRIMGEADPSTYGESLQDGAPGELEKKAADGDLTALEILADRCVQQSRLPNARQYWLQAVASLNSDTRSSNGPFYLKLAESYDPAAESPRGRRPPGREILSGQPPPQRGPRAVQPGADGGPGATRCPQPGRCAEPGIPGPLHEARHP